MKRWVDVCLALLGLLALFPALILVALLIKMDSRGPVFFKQERIGRNFKPFLIYKFRTMVKDSAFKGRMITVGSDPRITRMGRFLRKVKIDELPQLINVFKGEMSFVGPRPELRKYVEKFRNDFKEILSIRPGITDLASIKYRREAELLASSEDPEEEYISTILPEKIKLGKDYLRRSSLSFDFSIMIKTVLHLVILK